MNQFISKLWNIMEEEGTCGPFREIDLANFFFTPTGRVKDNFYGWRLSFATEANAPDITSYDDSIWDTLNTDTNGGSSVPGTLPGGRFDANYGTIITVPNGYVSYVATFSGSLHNTPIGLYIDKEMIIDWGDGSGIKSYPIDVLCLKTYSTDATATITVYHKNTAQVVFLIDDNSNVNNITLESITGTLPAPAWNICFGDHLPVLPTLPATARQIQLSATNISQEQVDALLDQLIANGVENGILQCPNTITLNGDKVNILRARNWSV
jgi:hypothetical protein